MAMCKHVQIVCNTSVTYHTQHAMCHMVQKNSSGINFDRVETSFVSSFISSVETRDQEEKETRDQEEKET